MNTTIKLHNGNKIPKLGLGVWQADGSETKQAVGWALEAGYRHIDTASIYGNEKEVGEAIRSSSIPREDIFVTTKLWRDDHDDVERGFRRSCELLDISYIDLYLSHFPATGLRLDALRHMEKIAGSEFCRGIGVSNYTIQHLEELIKETSIVPLVNQVEYHVYLDQKELREYCQEKGIVVVAYSPLAKGNRLADDTVLKKIAKYHQKTSAQIMLRWCLDLNMVTIPKSVSKNRIVENSQIFDFKLRNEDLKEIEALNSGYRTCWDPTGVI